MSPHTDGSTSGKPLRLWPSAVGAIVVVVGLFVVPIAFPDQMINGMFAAIGGGALIALWWVFLSRAPWLERLGAVAFGVVTMLAIKPIVDPSIVGAGMGMMMPMFGLPLTGLGLVAGAAVSRHLSERARRASIAIGMLAASGTFAIVRT